jgi:hypothetical protein
MQDHNAVGRNTSLSPVTWQDGWPYFGLPGNLTRTPSLWVKPNTGRVEPVTAPYDRSDDFSKPKLQAVWQWNHLPDDSKWSLTERPGFLRLQSLPAAEFWWARNSLTQRAIGPESSATTELDAAGMQPGDVAGLALLNLPYAWIGIQRETGGLTLAQYDQTTSKAVRETIQHSRVKLRVHCDFDTDTARFSYSTAGEFKPIGEELKLPFQLKTFQGVRYALFHYNASGTSGGYADFDSFIVDEPRPRGLTTPIPYGQRVAFEDIGTGSTLAVVDGSLQSATGSPTAFKVVDRGKGRIALQASSGQYLSVADGGVRLTSAKPTDAETFQWVDLQRGDTLLMSLATHRYLVAPKTPGSVTADHPGPAPDRKDGSCFKWKVVK